MEIKEFSNKIDRWDQRIILKYNGLGGKPLTCILKFISFFGRETMWISLIAFYLFIWYDPFLFSYMGTTFLFGLVIIAAIKQIVKRSRPFERFDENKLVVLERKPASRSFPSWHSYNIVSQGLLVGLFFLRSPLITSLILLFAIVVSFSRIQLGVHYPSDVIFGFFVGLIGFLLSIYIFAPIALVIITHFEQLMIHEIQYRQVNSILYKNVWYLLLVIIVFCGIFLTAIYKMIKDYFKKTSIKN